jgi:hypothetical protein
MERSMTRIFKTAVGAGNKILTVDTIEHEGGLWLVPKWLVAPTEGWQKPARIIRIDVLAHQDLRPKMFGPHHIVLSEPIPIGVLDLSTPPEEARGLTVIDNPDIQIDGSPTAH